MHGIHEVLQHDLLEISKRCQTLQQEITEFANIVSKLPAAMVRLRLKTMARQIMIQAMNLSEQHHGDGYVFVMIGHRVLGIHWAKKEYSAKTKEDLRRQGYLITSAETMEKVAEELSEKVDSGELAEAVDWINRYEPFLENH